MIFKNWQLCSQTKEMTKSSVFSIGSEKEDKERCASVASVAIQFL